MLGLYYGEGYIMINRKIKYGKILMYFQYFKKNIKKKNKIK